MRKLSIVVSVTILIAFFSCKKDSPAKPLNDLITAAGSWKITLFTEYIDTPTDYTDYSLIFHEDGKLQAQNNNETAMGTWRTYDIAGKDLYLSLDVQDNHLLYLEADWSLQSMTNTQIQFSAGLLVSSSMTLQKN